MKSQQLIVSTFLLTAILANCQTFQYSRGWTNGKRVEDFPDDFLGVDSELSVPQLQGTRRLFANLQADCRLQNLRMLFQRNGNEQARLQLCGFQDALRRSLLAQLSDYFWPRSSSLGKSGFNDDH